MPLNNSSIFQTKQPDGVCRIEPGKESAKACFLLQSKLRFAPVPFPCKHSSQKPCILKACFSIAFRQIFCLSPSPPIPFIFYQQCLCLASNPALPLHISQGISVLSCRFIFHQISRFLFKNHFFLILWLFQRIRPLIFYESFL